MEVEGLAYSHIDGAFRGIQRFDLEIPRIVQKRRWGFVTAYPGEKREKDGGAVRKRRTDWKLFFHFRPDVRKELRSRHGIQLNQWQREWFDYMEWIWNTCTAHHFACAREMDRLLPGYDFHERAQHSMQANCLRSLLYDPREGVVATRHTDRDALTQHIAESAPGLWAGNGKRMRPYRSPMTPQVLVFPGDQLALITNGKTHATEHQVEDTTDGKHQRFAMVFFGKMYPDEL
jgi:isopenicillin N synthase-like dioxygenase